MPTPLYSMRVRDLQSRAVADLLLSHICDHQSLFTLVPCYLVVWMGDLFTVLSPLDSLKLNEGVVRVTGFEPSITSIKSRVPYLSATRAYYGGKPRYRPEHLGVADPCLTSWLVCHIWRRTEVSIPMPLSEHSQFSRLVCGPPQFIRHIGAPSGIRTHTD